MCSEGPHGQWAARMMIFSKLVNWVFAANKIDLNLNGPRVSSKRKNKTNCLSRSAGHSGAFSYIWLYSGGALWFCLIWRNKLHSWVTNLSVRWCYTAPASCSLDSPTYFVIFLLWAKTQNIPQWISTNCPSTIPKNMKHNSMPMAAGFQQFSRRIGV